MKKHIIGLLSVLLLFAACKKDESLSVYKVPAGVPSFTSSISAIVLDSTKKNNEAVAFAWSEVNFGINAAVTYSLQFDVSGGKFENPQTTVIGDDMHTASVTVAALNAAALGRGLPAEVKGKLDVRVKAEVKQNGTSTNPSAIPATYSAVISIDVTPYPGADYPKLWVSGSFQSWSASTAIPLADTGFNGAYEGYVYFPATSSDLLFKILTAQNWDNAYGYVSDTKMALGASGNFWAPAAGLVKINANTETKDWSALTTTWSLVGDAVADDWNTDIPLTYDEATGALVNNSVAIKATGAFKFRANKAWTLNYGVDNNKLKVDGSNLTAPQGAGNYKVTLNLTKAGNYTWSVQKL
ncbi:SusE domain-containing protein [Filimonas effusa]|nr:SusE domain-containing protein [Filimonas effusa]